MATRYAVPSAAGWDWGSTANWSATDGGAGGQTVPANSDTAVLKCAFMPGAGFDQSLVTVTALHILDNFGGTSNGLSLGTAAAALQINATDLYISNSRLSYLKLTGTFTNVWCRKLGGATLYLNGVCTNFYGGRSGKVDIGDDCEMTTFATAGMNANIQADSTSAGDLELDISSGATVECARKISTGTISGKLIMKDAASIAISSGTANPKVASGGTLDIRSSGAISQATIMGGGTIRSDSVPGFLTAPVATLIKLHEGAKRIIPVGTLTVTTYYDIGAGGDADFGGPF